MLTTRSKSQRSRRIPKKCASRRGAALVEFAFIAPILFTIIFGCIEISRVNMIRNTSATAAYEGCRRGIVPGASASQASDAAVTVLRASLIKGETITVTPSTLTSLTDTVTVSISVPIASNGWIFSKFFKSSTVQASCTLNRERTSG